jgi:hypothetical protein
MATKGGVTPSLPAADGSPAGARTRPAMRRSASAEGVPPPPGPAQRLRLPLATATDVLRELARLYREGKAGTRDIADVSRLANVLGILGRMIETGDLEARLEALESAGQRSPPRSLPERRDD